MFYSLSLAVAMFAAWFITDLRSQIALAVWFVGAWLIFGGAKKIIQIIEQLARSPTGHSLQKNQTTAWSASIDDPVLVSIASRIKPNMTISQIESFINLSVEPSRTISAFSLPLER